MSLFQVNWDWNATSIHDLSDEDIKILLKNRGYNISDAKAQHLKNILISHYFVEDVNLKSWEKMIVEQLKVELRLRD